MPKEKHPSEHEQHVQQLLIQSISHEVLIPCQSREVARAIRSMFYSCARAHRIHETEHAPAFKRFRSRIYLTVEVMENRPNYNQDIKKFPYTLMVNNSLAFMDNFIGAALGAPNNGPPAAAPAPDMPGEPHYEEAQDLSDIEVDEDSMRNILAGISSDFSPKD